MKERTRRRIARVRKQVPLVEVLEGYGYSVRSEYPDVEQQFACDLHGDGMDQAWSGRYYPDNWWYCVNIGEPVLTSEGWVPLKNLENGLLPLVLDGTGVARRPLAYLSKGRRPCVRVGTGAGYEVAVTADHRIDTANKGWVSAGDLVVGDELVVPKPQLDLFNPCLDLRVPGDDLNSRVYKGQPNLELPDTWSESLGETMGFVFGDGWVTPRPGGSSGVVGLTCHARDVDDARRVFSFLQEWSGGRGGECHRTDTVTVGGKRYAQDQYVLSIGNDGFCEWFQRLGLAKQDPPPLRGLPQSLWSSPKVALRGFLRGIFATDGSFFRPSGRKGIKVNLYSVSERFLLDIQLVLLQFGIHSRVHPPASTRPDGVGYLQLATGRDIITFRDRVGVASRRKQSVLESFEYNPRGARPFRPRVAHIGPAGKMSVADISMPGNPSFVAGGIKVHNCFACGTQRDSIQTVCEKEDMTILAALDKLEKQFNLPPLPRFPEDDEDRDDEPVIGQETKRTYEDEVDRVTVFLDTATKESLLPMDKLLAFWELLDQVRWHVRKEKWGESKGRAVLGGLMKKVKSEIHAGYQ